MGAPSYRPSVVRARTLYISLDMPPLLDTKPTEPGRCSLHATMLSRVPAVSPMRNAPACPRQRAHLQGLGVRVRHTHAPHTEHMRRACSCHHAVPGSHAGQRVTCQRHHMWEVYQRMLASCMQRGVQMPLLCFPTFAQ